MTPSSITERIASLPASALGARRSSARSRRAVPKRSAAGLVSFTFDGFTLGSAGLGARVLEQASVRGTFYTAPDLWGEVRDGQSFADLADVDALHRQGHEIGVCPSSGAAAPSDRRSSRQHLQDVLSSAEIFERGRTDRRFSSFAHLDGPVHPYAKRACGRRFASCRSGVAGLNDGRVDLSFLRSVHLADHHLDAQSATRWLEGAAARGAWLIFSVRDVQEQPALGGTSRALLGHAVAEALRLQLEVLPVRHAVARFAFG